MLYNVKGDYFETDNGKNPVNLVEMQRNGKVYQIALKMAEY
jgi:hypothetical protein